METLPGTILVVLAVAIGGAVINGALAYAAVMIIRGW